MKVRVWMVWGLAAGSVLLHGCSLTKPRPDVHYYTLALTIPEAPPNTTKPSLIVRAFFARDPYNQERLVYRASPYQLDFYHYHRWAAAPAEQVTDWTRRYLRGSGLFTRVFPTADGNADLAVGGVIRQIEEVDHAESWEAILSIDFWLVRADQRSPLWFQAYTATQRSAKRNPAAVAEAMSRNLENILGRLVADLAPVVATLPAS